MRMTLNTRRQGLRGLRGMAGVGALGFVLALCGVTGVPGVAWANERHFTYTYETATLPSGTFELEPWTTFRVGRQTGYLGIDYRIEFEAAVTDRLQTSVYLNGMAEGSRASGTWQNTSEFSGVSSEWKLRLLDTATDPFGLALYGEVTVGASSFELEGKVLLDRRFGRFLTAANINFAHAWDFSGADTLREMELEVLVAAGYAVTPQLMVGIEARDWNHWLLTPQTSQTDSVIYAGPSIAWSARSYWLAASVMPQIAAPVGSTSQNLRNLTSQEAVDVRVLMGAHF